MFELLSSVFLSVKKDFLNSKHAWIPAYAGMTVNTGMTAMDKRMMTVDAEMTSDEINKKDNQCNSLVLL